MLLDWSVWCARADFEGGVGDTVPSIASDGREPIAPGVLGDGTRGDGVRESRDKKPPAAPPFSLQSLGTITGGGRKGWSKRRKVA